MMYKEIWPLSGKILQRFVRDGYIVQAAGLSYVTLLSLVPLMTVALSILAAFPVFQGIGVELQQLIFSNFVVESAKVVQQHLHVFMQQATQLSATGLLFLLITAVLMMFSMEQAFNRIWGVAKQRHALQAFLMYWAVLTLAPILVATGFILGHKIVTLAVFPYIFTFLAFTLLYVAVPNCKVKLRYAAPGALIATVFFELAKYGFSFYIKYFPTYKLLYGALAAIPIFLAWLYISWLVILFGALVNAELQHKYQS